MNYLERYYSNYDEEGRLLSNHGQVEYLTTIKYIHEIIVNDTKKILEVGAGTGRYSIELAKEGLVKDASETTIDVSDLPAGMYFITVGNETRKFVVK